MSETKPTAATIPQALLSFAEKRPIVAVVLAGIIFSGSLSGLVQTIAGVIMGDRVAKVAASVEAVAENVKLVAENAGDVAAKGDVAQDAKLDAALAAVALAIEAHDAAPIAAAVEAPSAREAIENPSIAAVEALNEVAMDAQVVNQAAQTALAVQLEESPKKAD